MWPPSTDADDAVQITEKVQHCYTLQGKGKPTVIKSESEVSLGWLLLCPAFLMVKHQTQVDQLCTH